MNAAHPLPGRALPVRITAVVPATTERADMAYGSRGYDQKLRCKTSQDEGAGTRQRVRFPPPARAGIASPRPVRMATTSFPPRAGGYRPQNKRQGHAWACPCLLQALCGLPYLPVRRRARGAAEPRPGPGAIRPGVAVRRIAAARPGMAAQRTAAARPALRAPRGRETPPGRHGR